MPVQRLEAVLVVEDDIAAVAVAGVLRDDDLAVIRGIDRRAFVTARSTPPCRRPQRYLNAEVNV